MSNLVLFHYIHFINCLPPADVGGAKRIYETVTNIDGFLGPLKTNYEETRTPESFLDTLKNIETNIRPDSIPLIHIDAHANKHQGINFSDGIFLSWDGVVEALARINAKISNRLFLVFCACSAFYINSRLHPNSKAPFSFCVSPYSEITLAQLEDIIPNFYHALVGNNSITNAVAACNGMLHPISSDIFLKDIMVRMMMTTMGKEGRIRREYLLSEIISQSREPVDKRHARAHIKAKLKLSNSDVQSFSRTYLCGRFAPFTAEEVIKEARQRTNSS